jgi:2-polyprenyl-3-methyl-5-hydroxy-6-metoxy-1,4-benzoquinol methylase
LSSGKYDAEIDLGVDNAHTRVIRLVGTHKHVLEVGCATGYMSRVLVEQFGCTVVGIELDADAADMARGVCQRVIVGDLDTLDLARELGADRFDVIVCADVLEHLKDPGRVLASLRSFLTADGDVVASIPNIGHVSVIAELLAGRFPYQRMGLLDDTHLHFFTRESIHDCFERAGLIITHLDPIRVEPPATEFRTDLSRLAPGLAEQLLAHEDSTTYQFILAARAAPVGAGAERLQAALDSLEPTPASGAPPTLGGLGTDATARQHRADAYLEAVRSRMTFLEGERDRQARALEAAHRRTVELEQEVGTHRGHIGFLQDEIARREARHGEEIRQLATRLALLQSGIGWRLLQRFRRLRVQLCPRGSRRERLYLAGLGTLVRMAGRPAVRRGTSPDPDCPPLSKRELGIMPVKLAKDRFLLDRRLSDVEFDRYTDLIEARKSWGYYQRMVIQDAAGHRLETPGTHRCHAVLEALDRFGFPRDLQGRTVLDIGCNAGFYSFAAKLRGAKSVLGLDHQPHYIEQAKLVREILAIDVDLQVSDGHTLDGQLGSFDVVINTGVVYHLQNPMDFLTRMGRLTKELMYLESEMLIDPKHADHAWFIEKEYCGDSSNWWVYGPRCLERMTRAAGFSRVEFQGFVWTPPPGTKTPEGFLRQGRGAFLCHK